MEHECLLTGFCSASSLNSMMNLQQMQGVVLGEIGTLMHGHSLPILKGAIYRYTLFRVIGSFLEGR